MKFTLLFVAFLGQQPLIQAQSAGFDKYAVYSGTDLGLVYTPARSAFRIWAPTAAQARLLFYNEGTGGHPYRVVDMTRSVGGTWRSIVTGNYEGKFYVFQVKVNGKWLNEVLDPYAKSVGVNGRRAMVIDLKKTNPPGWQNDHSPPLKNKTDAIVYELHVRDASISNTSGITHKGKFIGLTERGSRNTDGLATGLDHLKQLGITHVHLLPCYDFYSVDESRLEQPQYNWGYDPLNYNVPEGSYSTDPYNGRSRIAEFKQLIKSFHDNGLRVIMDVVYNHTMLTEDSYFNQLVPGYYYRHKPDGSFSDATACGNETASERPMMRKFILESVKYWVKEYHVDGFRFDLMGVHDIATMNLVSRELHKIKPDILLYGEGWTAGACPLPDSMRAIKANAYKLERIAVFSDDIRDGIKGSVFDQHDRGFASNKAAMEESIKFGVTAACKHPQIDYTRVNYSKAPYAAAPYQVITYTECHDNHVLADKLAISAADATDDERRQMHKLALSIVLTSQGIAFLHAGTEFMRTKHGVENSFKSPDSINAIDWSLKTKNKDVFDYVQQLIEMRKAHPAFRMTTAASISNYIRFLPAADGMVAYTIDGQAVKDSWARIMVVYNGSDHEQAIALPSGKWTVYIDKNQQITGEDLRESTTPVAAFSCSVFFQK